jgi:hypothetical protein
MDLSGYAHETDGDQRKPKSPVEDLLGLMDVSRLKDVDGLQRL